MADLEQTGGSLTQADFVYLFFWQEHYTCTIDPNPFWLFLLGVAAQSHLFHIQTQSSSGSGGEETQSSPFYTHPGSHKY